MLAVNSDVEFTTWPAQLDLIESAGRFGVEVSFSYWTFADRNLTWSVFDDDNKLSPEAPAAFALMRAGLIDTLHSYGGITDGRGVAFDRKRIEMALHVLREEGVATRIYSNHGTIHDLQNVGGSFAYYQQGDVVGHPMYHLDLSTDYGLKFYWTDVDYDNEESFFSINPGSKRPPLLMTQVSRDGTPIIRFRRFRGPLPKAPDAESFGVQVLDLVLRNKIEGYSIVYQHLGVHRTPNGKPFSARNPYYPPRSIEAWERLADLHRSGAVLVTTTERLLLHAALMTSKSWTIEWSAANACSIKFNSMIDVGGVKLRLLEKDLAGWALSVNASTDAVAYLDGKKLDIKRFSVGTKSYVGFPWRSIPTLEALEHARSAA